MKKGSLFKMIGPFIWIITYLINKFVIEVPNIIYMGLIIIAIGFLLSGMLLSQKD